MYRLLIARMQTMRAARSAAKRILFLCMGACFPLPPRRAPRVRNFEDDLSSLLPAAQSFEYEASCAADVCCPVPPHRAGEGGVDGVLAQARRVFARASARAARHRRRRRRNPLRVSSAGSATRREGLSEGSLFAGGPPPTKTQGAC